METKNKGTHTPQAFSFYKAPVTNTMPYKTVNLALVHKAITGNHYERRTHCLRAISDPQQARKFKAANLDYCTFSGVFTSRNNKRLVQHSGLLAIDFDHLPDVGQLRQLLLRDECLETQLLFVSPSGTGLKWIISVDLEKTMPGYPLPLPNERHPDTSGITPEAVAMAHRTYFTAVANYILYTYKVGVDTSGRDVSRACFLAYDPDAYINPGLL